MSYTEQSVYLVILCLAALRLLKYSFKLYYLFLHFAVSYLKTFGKYCTPRYQTTWKNEAEAEQKCQLTSGCSMFTFVRVNSKFGCMDGSYDYCGASATVGTTVCSTLFTPGKFKLHSIPQS